MSDEKNAGVDPRFDPAFQRGFDTSIPIEEYVPAPLPRKLPTPAAQPAKPAAVVPAATAPVVSPAAVAPAPDATALELTDSDSAPEVEPDASASRNPFLLFLGIISVALVVAGIWLFVQSGDAFNSKEVRSQGDYMSLDATIHMAPFIALLGGATAIGVLFVFAAQWRRRR